MILGYQQRESITQCIKQVLLSSEPVYNLAYKLVQLHRLFVRNFMTVYVCENGDRKNAAYYLL